jgi:acetylornithine deacetylase/succinyl-diaminopimelate desuccinylase-like protein
MGKITIRQAQVTFQIRYGKGDDFRSAVAKVYEANQKLKTPVHYEWYRLANGGRGGTYVLTTDHANWASFEDDPAVKPMRDRLREAFGEQEAMSVIERLNGSIESTYSDLVQTRPDLSYVPAK